MKLWLMIATIVAVLLLVIVLSYYLRGIIALLTRIGGDGTSYLAKLRLGLRAIETETGHLPVEVSKLNQTLSDIGDGLTGVDQELDATIQAALKQKEV